MSLLYGKLRERAVCGEFCVLIGYPSGQDGAILPARDCPFHSRVVIGADSHTTTGAYIANRVTDKLTPVTEKVFCCRSGSAAATQAIADVAKYHLNFR